MISLLAGYPVYLLLILRLLRAIDTERANGLDLIKS